MTRAVKVGLAVGASMAIGLLTLALVSGYFVLAFAQGAELAEEGYAAIRAGDYDKAIARFDAALKKPIGDYHRQHVRFNRAVALSNKSRLEEAIADCTEALRSDFDSTPSAYAWRGWDYEQLGEAQKAMADYNKALRRDPNLGWAYENRGLILYNRHDFDAALKDFDELARCKPNDPRPFLMRGLCYVAKNDLDHALANLDAALMIDPHNARALRERGRIYQLKGEREKSVRDYVEEDSLKLFATNEPSRNGEKRTQPLKLQLGTKSLDVPPLPKISSQQPMRSYEEVTSDLRLAFAGRQYEHAIALSNEALAMDITPSRASTAVMLRGYAFFLKNKIDKASRDFDEAIKLDPKNGDAHVYRGFALKRIGKRDEGMKEFDLAMDLDYRNWFAYLARARLLGEDGDFTSALEDLNHALSQNPDAADVYITRAAIYLRENDPDNAIANCDRAIEIQPDSVPAHINRARAYAKKNDYAQTKRDADLAAQKIGSSRDLESALNSIAWFRASCPIKALRDGPKAVKQARRACELSGWQSSSAIDTLACAYAETNQFDQAVQYEKKALTMNPGKADRARMQNRLALFYQHEPYHE